jgi:penicillin-binding protein, 1A family
MGPPPTEVPESTLYYAEDGSVISESGREGTRYWLKLEDIPEHFILATLAIEDQRFYAHLGFDLKRIAAAIWEDVKAMDKVQGASTISQQYARNLFLSHEKTWKRKIKEALYTVRLEANLTKDEILEGYLNTIYYGHGAYGVEAASRFYFGKIAADLTLAEAAMLAGIPKGPGRFSPLIAWGRAKNRQELILSVMAKKGIITEEERKQAVEEHITIQARKTPRSATMAPYFRDVVETQLRQLAGLDERTLTLGGLKVYTTLDPAMQRAAEEVFSRQLPDSGIQGALLAMDPNTGYVKALVGGRNYEESPFNRAVDAARQAGSTIKPILYYAALERGFTPVTKFLSEKTTFRFDGGKRTYTPKNFNDQYAEGELTLAQALALSDNIFAVKTHLYLGPETLADYAESFGIRSPQNPVPSLALGTSTVRPIELAVAYSHLANGGKAVEPVFIKKVEDRRGKIIYEHKREKIRILDEDVVFILNHLLTGTFDSRLNGYAPVTGEIVADKLSREYAGKSGTTDHDSWMIGYTPDLVGVVWVGYDRGKPIAKYSEKQAAKHIWADFMEKALEGRPVSSFLPTKGVTGVSIDPATGQLADESCPVKRYTYFIKGTEPTIVCEEHGHSERKPSGFLEESAGKPWYRRWLDWLRP